jgi:CO/xanthine dehydrogenase Mo-binding subunit
VTNASRIVGEKTGRIDGPDKTTGRGKYVVDAALPDMLWCKILRSPVAHARVVRIDTTQALAVPGVHAVVTGEDVRDMRTGNLRDDEPLLASWDRVRFIGDKVAAVVADDPDIAQRALNLIDVEYESLPAVFDAEEAALPGAPIVHPDSDSYRRFEPMEEPGNVWERVVDETGDLDRGFEEADTIVERTYRTPKAHQLYLEPHTCLVNIDHDERVQVWVTSQSPTAKRVSLARMMGIPRDQITINVAYLGGSFGGKGDATGVMLCYLLAKKTGRPVKFIMDYAEELATMNPRHSSVIRIRAGVKWDGRITAWDATGTFGTGAYAGYAPDGSLLGTHTIAPYSIENARLTALKVYTNVVPSGYFRGPGQYQSSFASESHIDVIASELGMSPLDVRLVNIRETSSGGLYPSGQQAKDPTWKQRLEAAISEAVEASGYLHETPTNVGRGMALAMSGTGGMDGHAQIQVFESGRIVANMPTSDPGVGIATILAQIVAEELDVPIERVQVAPWSTDESPNDWGFGGSRGARMTSIAGYEAAQDFKNNTARLAAEFFGWNEERITVRSGSLVDESSGDSTTFEEIASRVGAPVSGRADVYEEEDSVSSFAVHVAEIEVDPETGAPKLTKYTAVQETGRVLNPVGFTSQIEGGVVMAIGHALTEELVFDPSDGRVINPSLADYKIPSEPDLPPIQTVVLDSELGHGPYQVRAIGDIPIVVPAPAVANAIAEAIGVRVTELPATAERIRGALGGDAVSAP